MQLSNLPQQIVFGLGLGAIYALVAIGFSLIYRTMGLLSFVHPQFVMLGSVFGYTALVKLDLPLWQAAVPVGIVTAAASVVVDQVGLRPIRRRGGTEIAMILATVAWGIVLVELVRQPWAYGPNALSLRSGARAPFHVLGIEIRWDTVGTLATAAVLAAALAFVLRRTAAGRALRAVGENSRTAALMGIDVERTLALAAAISGFLGGVAGLLVGYLFSAGIATGAIGVKALAAAVIGGFGNVPGAVVGGLLLGVFDNVVAADISATWRDAIVYGLIIAVLLLRAGGLVTRRLNVRALVGRRIGVRA
jgi:branched-chain amino acid transport system permease protein